jgi:hypothetical protein
LYTKLTKWNHSAHQIFCGLHSRKQNTLTNRSLRCTQLSHI